MTYDWSSYGIIVWENKLVGVRKIVNGMPGKWGPPGGKRTPSEMTALQKDEKMSHLKCDVSASVESLFLVMELELF